MTTVQMDEVDVLIPKSILDRRKSVIREACLDYAALVDVMPATSSGMDEVPASPLLDADPHACRAWLARVIRALPTQSDMEPTNGDV